MEERADAGPGHPLIAVNPHGRSPLRPPDDQVEGLALLHRSDRQHGHAVLPGLALLLVHVVTGRTPTFAGEHRTSFEQQRIDVARRRGAHRRVRLIDVGRRDAALGPQRVEFALVRDEARQVRLDGDPEEHAEVGLGLGVAVAVRDHRRPADAIGHDPPASVGRPVARVERRPDQVGIRAAQPHP